MKPLLLGFVNFNGDKTVEDFPGFLWRNRVEQLHIAGYFLSHQFDNHREAYRWEASPTREEKKKKEKKKKMT